ncbi:cyclin [Pyrrhoderma noxium]|uniref:Cyclin n=1 Tax=Pyrrhoderma noxium TaxID=2282107 RepID=A0A286UW17_9AGAM|nr:cyclin [Pyrrhoderma noxium]
MGANGLGPDTVSTQQWMFPTSALLVTPSASTSSIPLEKELYDRARGIEFLYRLGASLQLPSTALFTAATWFHRFYMRFSMEDYHRQDIAGGCIFLATKTEECGRKLRDVAKVAQSKITGTNIETITDSEVQQVQEAILQAEEALLEALCFDFTVEHPHELLVDLCERFASEPSERVLCDSAWSIAHDSYRTVLCLLFDIRIIAAACFILAQRFVDGENSPSLDARIASSSPSASLPTPPTNKPNSPDASRVVVNYFQFSDSELTDLAESLTILIEYYNAQDIQGSTSFLRPLAMIHPPATPETRQRLYLPLSHVSSAVLAAKSETQTSRVQSQRTPESTHGDSLPAKPPSWKPVRGEAN